MPNEVTAAKKTALTPQTTIGAQHMAYELIKSGAPLDSIREFLTMSREIAADVARQAFNEAFAAFKAEAVSIVRNREITDGPLKGRKYAELFSFVDAVTPALSKHGLSASWNITKDEKDWIEVTCTIEHVLGGNKKVPMGGPPDTGGAKNAIQARLSAITYLERGTLKAACGLAEQGDDKDGNVPGELVSIEELADLQTKLANVEGDVAAFCEHFKIDALADMPKSYLPTALQIIANKARKMGK